VINFASLNQAKEEDKLITLRLSNNESHLFYCCSFLGDKVTERKIISRTPVSNTKKIV
jgi:hypothetical protein